MVTVVVAGVLGSGCHSWHRQVTGPAETVTSLRPEVVRLTLLDSGTVVLRSPEIRADSIVGARQNSDGLPIAVPISQVREAEVRRFSAVRTLVLVASPVAVWLGIYALAVAYSGGNY